MSEAKPKKKKIPVAKNSKARFDYKVEDSIQAGIVLKGCEVKSLRAKTVSFSDAWVRIEDGQAVMTGMHINTFDKTRIEIPDPVRERKLLLSKTEIAWLNKQVSRSGYTLIPLEIYFLGSWAKVLVGICKGKSHGDKRAALKEKAVKRDMERGK
jgi:SsrA-binding protein